MSDRQPDDAPEIDESTSRPKRRWILLGVPVCLFLGWVEYQRALDGNERAWVYTFEWPAFAAFTVYMYYKIRKGEPVFKPYKPDEQDDEVHPQ